MALFGRDYDRDYGYRGGNRYGGGGYDRGLRGRAQYAWNETKDETSEMFGRDYDRNYRGSGTRGGYGTSDRDRSYGRGGYDRGYKSRAETDYGDPFGDRQNRTPIRMVNEDRDRGGYDRGYRARGYGATGYDRDYGTNPMGYDPSGNTRGGYGNAGYDRGFRRNY